MKRNIQKNGSFILKLVCVFLLLLGSFQLTRNSVDAEGEETKQTTSITPGEEAHYLTTEFYVGDAEEPYDTQIVANGESVIQPANPVSEGQKFIGWYLADDSAYTFGEKTVTADATEKVYAKFVDVFYVFFVSEGTVVHTKEVEKGSTTDASNVAYVAPEGKGLLRWADEVNGASAHDFTATVNSNVTVYAVYGDRLWVTFNTDGGTAVNPMASLVGGSITLPSNSTRVGYTLSGWTDGTNTFHTGASYTVNADADLTAVWAPNTNTKFIINYWIENADDTNYTFEKSVNATGTSGATIVLSDAQKNTSNLNSSYRNYFNFKEADSNVVIDGNGSSVINVYFSRKTYTLTFQSDRWNTVATITAKYDAAISGEFNKAPFNTTYNGRAWKATNNDVYQYALQTLDRMPGANVTFRLYDKNSNTQKTIYYYVQKVDSTVNPTSWPSSAGTDYELLKSVNTYFNYATYDEEYHEIEGFTRFSSNVAGFDDNEKDFDRNNTLALYYIRNSYTLTYQNGDKVAKTETIKYEAPLSSYASYTPTERPSDIPANFTFQGWYKDSSCTQAVDWANTNMPAGNMIVYAKWAAPQISVMVYVTVLDEHKLAVPYGTAPSATELQTLLDNYFAVSGKTQSDFVGWYWTVDGEYVPYKQGTKLYGDTALYAEWNTEDFTVTYDGGEGSPTDSLTYKSGAYAEVKGKGSLTNGSYLFVGWQNDGKLYYEGSKLLVTGDMVLTPYWAPLAATASVTYHANGGSGADYAVQLLNNAAHTVLAQDDASLNYTRNGYIFLGWALSAAGAVAYQANDTIRVNNQGSNDLYAVWENNSYNLTVNLYKGNPGTGVKIDSKSQNNISWDAIYALSREAHYEIANDMWNTNLFSNGNIHTTTWTPSVNKTAHDYVLNVYLKEDSALFVRVNYYANNGTSASYADPNNTYFINSEVTVLPLASTGFTAPSGRHFDGWNTKADGTGTSYAPGGKFNISANTNLYAKWAINSHTLTIHYVYENNDTAHADYNDTLEYNEGYNITSPLISGYVADMLTVSGAMGDSDVEVTVTYSRDTFAYTVNYYKESIASENLLTTVNGSGEFEANIPYVTGETLPNGVTFPVGYKAPGVASNVTGGNGTISVDATKNIVNVVYPKDDSQVKEIKYTVEHWVAGEKTARKSYEVKTNVWINSDEPLNIEDIALETYEGYKYDNNSLTLALNVDKDGLVGAGTIANGGTILVNYVKDDTQKQVTSYTVEHWVAGETVARDSQSYNGTAWVLDDPAMIAVTSESVAQKSYTGYKFGSIENYATSVESGTVIKLNYVKDDSQVKEIKYTVEHWVTGETVARKSYEVKTNVWVNDPDTLNIEDIALEAYKGYKYGNNSATLALNADEDGLVGAGTIAKDSTIKVNYVKDDSQVKEIKYTVEHWVTGETVARKSYEVKTNVWVNDPDTLNIEDIALETYKGYKYGNNSATLALNADEDGLVGAGTIANGGKILVNYVKDDTQKQVTSYTVEHWVAGETVARDSQSYNGTAWVLDDPAMIAVTSESVAQKSYTGYKFGSIENYATSVVSGTVIKLNYVKDDSQVKEIKYTVEHWVTGETVARKSYEVKTNVWVNDPDTLNIEDIALETYKGYKYGNNSATLALNADEDGLVGAGTIANGGTILVNYVKDDSQTKNITYYVEYYKDGVKDILASYSVPATVWVNEPDTVTVKAIDTSDMKFTGYKFVSTNPEVLPTTAEDGDIIKVYYVRDDAQKKVITYSVEYYKDGVKDTAASYSVPVSVWVNVNTVTVESIDIADDKFVGFKFDHTIPATLPTTAKDGDLIKVYYVKDDSQVKEIKYTVEHWVAGEKTARKSYEVKTNAWVNDPDTLSIEDIALESYQGYKYGSNDASLALNTAETGLVGAGTIAKDSTIKVNYVKDDSQTQITSYTVEHWVTGETVARNSQSYNGTAWINDNPAMIAVTSESVAQKSYTGYKFGSIENYATSVESGTVIKLNYVKDDSQVKEIKYTVEHWVTGETVARKSYEVKTNVWVNDPDTLNIEGITLETYKGYKYGNNDASLALNTAETGLVGAGTIAKDSTIKVNYVKDDSQVKEIKYTVEHWVTGETVARKSYEVKANVWINSDEPLNIADIDLESYQGYKYDNNSATLVLNADKDGLVGAGTIANGGKILVNYVKDDSQTQITTYTVEHWVTGETTARDSQSYNGTAWVNDNPAMIAVTDASIAQKSYTGYKFGSIENYAASVVSGTVIKLNYVKDDSQTQITTYTVEHWVTGEITARDSQSYNGTAWINDNPAMIAVTDASIAQKSYKGYKYDSIENYATSVVSGTVIKLNYVKDDAQTQITSYTVEHWVAGETTARDSQSYNGTAWINDNPAIIAVTDASIAQKSYKGYKYDSIENYAASVVSGTVIKLNYVKDDAQTQITSYTVEHWVAGETAARDSQSYNGAAWVLDNPAMITVTSESVAQNTYSGYKFGSIENYATSVVSGTVIKLNYVKDDSQTKDVIYTVNYYVDGILDTNESDTYTVKVWVNDPSVVAVSVTAPSDKYPGYKLDTVASDAIPTEANDGDVFNFYYVADSFKLNVKHIYQGTTDIEDIIVDNVDTLYNTPLSYTTVAKAGYSFDHATVSGLVDTNADDAIVEGTMPNSVVTITFYYNKDTLHLYFQAGTGVSLSTPSDARYAAYGNGYSFTYDVEDLALMSDFPAITLSASYINGAWDKALPTALAVELDGTVYTANAELEVLPPVTTNHTVSFVALIGGSLAGSTSFSVPNGGRFGDYVTIPTMVANTNYRIVGWTTALPGADSTVNASATYYAQFAYAAPAVTTYSVTFAAEQGGSLNGATVYSGIASGADFYTVVTVPTVSVNEGYTFSGWDNDLPEAGARVTSNMTFTAQFDEIIVEPITPIDDQVTPEAQRSWALVNLIATILTSILGIVLLFSKLKKDEEEDEEKRANADDETSKEYSRRKYSKVLGILASIAAIIVFILTEDMSTPMRYVDKYTLAMVAILLVGAINFYFGRKWKEADNKDEEAKAQA